MSDPSRRGGTIDREVTRTRGTATNGSGRQTGAQAAGGAEGGRRRRGLLPWLLGGLALLALAGLLAALLSGGDDKKTAGAAGAGASTLTAGSTKVLPGKAAGLGEAVGESASGKSVVVQSIVKTGEDPNAREGFWVGSSAEDRVYVEYGGDVGGDEASFRPKVGQRVNLEGPVKAAPEEAARVLNLNAEDAALVERQGAYINADRVTPAS